MFLRSANQEVVSVYGGSGGGVYFRHNNTQKLKLEGGNWTYQGSPTVTFDGNILASSDSAIDIGTNSVRFRNIYADTLYGDGSNLTNVSGPTGPTGSPGPTGPTGQKGQKGQQGSSITGPPGPTGPTGPTGYGQKGQKGQTGNTGPTGSPGSNGSNGAAGAKGQKGEIGPTGSPGAAGPAGGNASQLGGYGLTGSGNRWGGIPPVYSDGVMEIGNYIDFHGSDGSTADFPNGRISGGSSLIYFSKNISVNGSTYTSDRNIKNTIVDSDLGLDFINMLRPKSFKFNHDLKELDFDNKTHYGLIAQDVEDVITGLGKTLDDISIAVKPEDKFQNGDDMPMSVDYTQLITVLIKAVQEMSAKVVTLETKVTNLENGN